MNLFAPLACLMVHAMLVATDSFADAILEMHTQMRSDVKPAASNMKMMNYSEPLAILAKKWAKRCQFAHPDNSHPEYDGLGQNIAWQSGHDPKNSIRMMVEAWFAEWKLYDYQTGRSKGVTGHYTQMVWADTKEIGCAVISCSDLENHGRYMGQAGEFLVCQYSPPGKYIGQKPYKAGKPCSFCKAGDSCVRNQCVAGGGGGAAVGKPTTSKPTGGRTPTSTKPSTIATSTSWTSKPSTGEPSTSESRRFRGRQTTDWGSARQQFFASDPFAFNSGWSGPDKRGYWTY